MPALRTFREAYGRPGRHEFPLFRRGLKSTLGQVYIGTGIRGEWSGVPFPHGGRRWSRLSLCLPIPDIRSRYNSLKGEPLRAGLGRSAVLASAGLVGAGALVRTGGVGAIGRFGGAWAMPAQSQPAQSQPAQSQPAQSQQAQSQQAQSQQAQSLARQSSAAQSMPVPWRVVPPFVRVDILQTGKHRRSTVASRRLPCRSGRSTR